MKNFIIYTIPFFISMFCGVTNAIVVDKGTNLQNRFPNNNVELSGVLRMGGCTTTVIADRLILSAGHCVDISYKDGIHPISETGGKVRIDVAGFPSDHRWVKKWIWHTGWTNACRYNCNWDAFKYDIAIGLVDEDFPPHVQRYKIANYSSLDAGLTLLLTGYGNATRYGGVASLPVSSIPINWGLNEVLGFKNNNFTFTVDFDQSGLLTPCPPKECYIDTGVSYPSKRYGINEAIIARGDSGGPVFSSRNLDATWTQYPDGTTIKLLPSTLELVGVTSFGSNEFGKYGVTGGFVNLAKFKGWIDSTVRSLTGTSLAASSVNYSSGAERIITPIDAPNISVDMIVPPTFGEEIGAAVEVYQEFDVSNTIVPEIDSSTFVAGDSSVSIGGNNVDDSTSFARLLVKKAGHLNFSWKVSSEEDFDFLELRINGETIDKISGEKNWTTTSYPIDENSVIEWLYIKDFSVTDGLDRGWIDNIQITDQPDCEFHIILKTVVCL